MESLSADPLALGQDLARAGLQFLGLFPVLEGSSPDSLPDPLDDTPLCTDVDGDGQLSTEECAGKGAENLMWPLGGAQATELSADQVWVLQRNPLLQ
jgi:hypothetical protein